LSQHARQKRRRYLQELAVLEVQTHQALALLEATIPRSEMVIMIMIHVMGHLPHQIRKFGPIRQHWMYPLESFFGVRKHSVDYRKIPEAAIMTRYCMMKTVQNLELAVESSKGIHNASDKAIYQPAVTGLGRSKAKKVTFPEMQRVQAYLAAHHPAYPALQG